MDLGIDIVRIRYLDTMMIPVVIGALGKIKKNTEICTKKITGTSLLSEI